MHPHTFFFSGDKCTERPSVHYQRYSGTWLSLSLFTSFPRVLGDSVGGFSSSPKSAVDHFRCSASPGHQYILDFQSQREQAKKGEKNIYMSLQLYFPWSD